ncbi:MAG: HdeD family acid-resistance protein [Streptosporangiaceae bacterium]
MPPEDQETPLEFLAASAWQTTLFLGVATVILGLIVTFHPSGSLNVIAVLVGILMIISGIFHLIRVFDSAEQHRVWLGIAGLLYVVIGVVLIRHLNLTVAVIGLIVGLTWIVQGLSGLFGGIAGSREGRGWWIFFGIVSLIAGIVVVADPISSVTVLAVLLGLWFIVMGLFEVIAAFIIRRAVSESPSAQRFADEGATTLLPARERDRQEDHHGQRERVVCGGRA